MESTTGTGNAAVQRLVWLGTHTGLQEMGKEYPGRLHCLQYTAESADQASGCLDFGKQGK